MSDGGIFGNGVHVETPDGIHLTSRLGILTSVFRSELIAIYKGLQLIDTASGLVFRDIWILTDSRASHSTFLVGDMTSLNILDLVVRLSSRHSIYFQWVHSHIGLNGNEIADSLAKCANADALRGDVCLTFGEISSIKRVELNALRRVPPSLPWYLVKKPR
ncbi:uncharacterized protein TNCV_4766141 [Trichonephila clavipes]|nr:uncharacterized protein TNCV_4766141 [Trichonephila clavipes]